MAHDKIKDHSTESARTAIRYLQIAQKTSDQSPQLYRDLAHAYVILKEYDSAIEAIEQAARLSPSSPLIQQELAEIYTLSGRIALARQAWDGMGVNNTQIESYAQHSFQLQKYSEASRWYQQVAPLVDSTEYDRIIFMALLSSIYTNETNDALIKASHSNEILTEIDANGTLIQGKALRWLLGMPERGVKFGIPLNFKDHKDVGTLWWNGEAITLIQIQQAATYQIDISVCNCGPPPIEMRVGIDGQVMKSIALLRDDKSDSRITFQIQLTPGIHAVHVWFDNNAIVSKRDRNAVVSKIEVQPIFTATDDTLQGH